MTDAPDTPADKKTPDQAPEPAAAAPTPPAAPVKADAADDMPGQPGAAAKPPPSVAEGGTAVPGSALSEEELEQLSTDIVAALKTVYDPEIPSDIYEIGLIYKIDVDDDRNVDVEMTLTAPGCPVAGDMPGWVENAVRSVPGVNEVTVTLTFDPPWHMGRMSDEAKLALNMF